MLLLLKIMKNINLLFFREWHEKMHPQKMECIKKSNIKISILF
jgi:hypothetical protein